MGPGVRLFGGEACLDNQVGKLADLASREPDTVEPPLVQLAGFAHPGKNT